MCEQNHGEECGMNKVLFLGVQLVLSPQSIWLVVVEYENLVRLWIVKESLNLVV